MNFTAQIKVMPLKELLDPQGKAVLGGLGNLGISAIEDVRVGKHITLQIAADDAEAATAIANEAARKLLANPVMEIYEIELEELPE
jgi:phosphoribosylformylglycinamidine synthase